MPTPNTGIPYVPENTDDPAAGLNLALNVIDALLQTAVIDMDQTAPPGSPADGDLHIVAGSATGAWVGEDNNLARYVADGAFWQFYEAGVNVHLVLNKDDGGLYAWDGAAWAPAVAGGGGGTDRSTVSAVSSSSGVVTLNYALGDYFTLTLTENVTSWAVSNPPGAGKGFTLMVQITQGAGPYTIADPGTFAEGATIDVPTANGDIGVLAITSFDNGSTLRCSSAKDFA